MAESRAYDPDWPSQFRGRVQDRKPYRFTIEDVYAVQRLGVLCGKGGGFKLMGGIMLMRSSDVPLRLHSSDLPDFYAAAIIPADVQTEMIEGVVYHSAPSSE